MSRKGPRHRFELMTEIIELCQFPGLPPTNVSLRAGVSYDKLRRLVSELVEEGLIRIETRPVSPSGQKRETDYLIMTSEGARVVSDFMSVRARLTREGAPSRSG